MHRLGVRLRGAPADAVEVRRHRLEQFRPTRVHVRAGLAHLARRLQVVQRPGEILNDAGG